ncbi:MAG TPA: hypothetical protein VGQ42_16710 [Candidatus Dormibacteraeota bacterium]|nr:hypothetical protein [Candidatus Dormibacteraeota bacterium]
MNIKRIVLAGVATGLAALTPAIMPASASASTAAVAAFSGSASATVDWVGGAGSFSFATSAPLGCTAAGVVNNTPVAGACTISASGTFVNVVCGTGTATGSATVTTSGGTVTVGFQIVFVATVGLILPTVPPAGVVAGVVQITANSPQVPTATPPTFGVCTNGFTVSSVSLLAQP